MIAIALDQSAQARDFKAEVVAFAVGLTLLLASASAIPVVVIWRRVQAPRFAEHRLDHIAQHDTLTEPSNRAWRRRSLSQAMFGKADIALNRAKNEARAARRFFERGMDIQL